LWKKILKIEIMKKLVIHLGICSIIATSCVGVASNNDLSSNEELSSEASTNEVIIGKQVWMKENLDVDKFRNGDPIPEAKTNEDWEKAGKNGDPAWCYYNNNPENGNRYGKLYNWFAVNDPRGLAPEGWKIPSDEDWSRLTGFLGGESVAGKKIKFTDFWVDIDGESGNGNNESGFSGLPGGYRNDDGEFSISGKYGRWWSSTKHGENHAWFRWLYSGDGDLYRGYLPQQSGYSVRCLRN